jgi:hypothetical protein
LSFVATVAVLPKAAVLPQVTNCSIRGSAKIGRPSTTSGTSSIRSTLAMARTA